MKRPAILCATALVVALFACSSNDGNGAFPFSGPSCAQITSGCWGCIQQNCNGDCITSACSDYFTCFCQCASGDQNCYAGCQSKAMTSACEQCALGVASQSCTQSCDSACSSSSMGGSGSGGSGSGSSGVGSSGVGGSSGGSGGGQVCSTSNGGCPLTFCATQANGTCTSAYYQVGSQTFQCASCTDTQTCAQEAANACLDGGPVADVGPIPDVGPPTDVGPVPDASGATCTPHPCGDGGQFEYCVIDDDAGTCTQAWFQAGGQVFDCTDCSAQGCMAAEQAALMACP